MHAVISPPLGDAVKLLTLVVSAGGLLALGRWSSRLGGSSEGFGPPADSPTLGAAEVQLDTPSSPKEWPPSAEEVAASLPFDPSLGNIRIKKFFFKKTDVTPGPDDPEVFADELHIQLYDPDSDHDWWQSYFVATPRGLEGILREKHWRYLHAPEILVLSRFNLEEIRRAAVSRIVADHEFFKESGQGEEETL